ncbi:hypothetical protein PS1_005348 [Malus domestica]
MAKKNLGFLMRQLLGNSNNPGAGVGLLLHRRMHIVSNSTQTLPQTLPQALPCSSIIPSYSLHSLQHRRKPNIFESEPDSDSLPKKRGKKDSNSAPPPRPPLPPFSSWYWQPPTVPPPPYPPNTVLYNSKFGYDKALKKIRDERLPSVLFFTVHGCKKTSEGIHPFFPDLCEQFKHITIYVFPLEQCGMLFSMQFLGLKSPTFQFYLNGEKVEEISTGSIKRVIKTFENVYSPSGMKKRRRRQGPKAVKNEEVDPSNLSKVLPNRFPASAYPKVMEMVESLPEANPLSELWWFAKGLFTSDEKRERFCELEDDRAKLEWLHCEMAE